VTFTAKIKKLDEIITKMPRKVIYGAWNESGLVDLDPNLLNKNIEFVHDNSEDEYVKLDLCEESARLVESFKSSEPF
jgi:hypothetical protein